MPATLINAILQLHASHHMFPPQTRILAAVSGGQDSCALLHALHSLKVDLSIELHAAHLHHGIRGEEADQDAESVTQLCGQLGVRLSVEKADVHAFAKQRRISIQEAAREVRHAYLQRVAQQIGASRIALGHTRDDQVETVLLNILRGTGIEGLQGLAPVSGNKIRPLLYVFRQETAEYCRQHGIAFREDSSNRSLRYRRNRVRTELLPKLETYYNPEVRSALLRLSDIAALENDYLQACAQQRYKQVCLRDTEDQIVLSVERLCDEHLAIQRRIVRLAIQRIRGGLHEIEFACIERCVRAMEAAAQSGAVTGFTLPGQDIGVKIDSKRICLTRRAELSPVPTIYRQLRLPGETRIEEWGLTIRCQELSADHGIPLKVPGQTALMDRDALRPPLIVRSRQIGDVIAPLGMQGRHRKLQDIFTDRKVPLSRRDRIPVIADSQGIVWVAGCVLSERVKVHRDTSRILKIECLSDPQSQ
jgi:tRNA(Ile)-lysidine synthase